MTASLEFNVPFETFLKGMVEQNGDLATSEPSVFNGSIPPEYILAEEDVEQLLGRPERLTALDEEGFHELDNTLGKKAVDVALEEGLSICASPLQKNAYELPRMKKACESIAKAVGAPAVFAALHITPDGEWGSGQHADIGWTFVYQQEGIKTWNLKSPKYSTLEEFLAARDPDGTDYINGPHDPGTPIVLTPQKGLFIPTGWSHAGIATGLSKHTSFGGAIEGAPLADIYGD